MDQKEKCAGGVVVPALTGRRAAKLFGDDTGAATAEYAIATMATMMLVGHTRLELHHAPLHRPAGRDLRPAVCR
jgi:hypothetical protein